MKKSPLIILIPILIFVSCHKDDDPCKNANPKHIDFSILEKVGDTTLRTDTAFANTALYFQAADPYQDIQWKIGDDARVFTTSSVNLYFTDPEILAATLHATQNTPCLFETKTVSRDVAIVKNDGSLISPLEGRYFGANTDSPADTFTVEVKFRYGSWYPWWPTGAYEVKNIPKGFSDVTQNFNGFERPEINGIICTNGYKNFAIDKSGVIPAKGIKGYGSLSQPANDTLTINYQIIDTDKLTTTGELSYLQKRFVGKRVM